MIDASNMIAKGWKLDGVPARMIPLTCEVAVERYDASGIHRTRTTHHVQLERDGRRLTQADRLPVASAGERDGWLKR